MKRAEDGRGESDPLLLVAPRIHHPQLLAHRSHSSHSSHSSHQSHSSGGYVGGGSAAQVPDVVAPAPPPPKPAQVSVVAYPGGKIFVNGKLVGTDSTSVLTLKPGTHEVRVVNAFVGDTNQTLHVDDGQTGMIIVKW